MQTILSLFNEAKKNNGRIKIPFTGVTYKQQLDALIDFFCVGENQYSSLIAPLIYTRTNKVTQGKKEFLNRIIIKFDDNFMFINMYELFNLPPSYHKMKNLIVFEDFFKVINELTMKNYNNCYIRFFYDHDPVKLEPSLSIRSIKNNNMLTDVKSDTKILCEFLNNNPLFNQWTLYLAQHIRVTGRWTWIDFSSTNIDDLTIHCRNQDERYLLPNQLQKCA
jgi:hypothetical protein